MLMLEDEVAPPLFEVVVLESPPVCTLWSCAGHCTREETKAVHDALDAAYREVDRPS